MSEMTLNEVEESISYLEAKIEKQGMVINERDTNHLDNLNQLYISLIMKEGRNTKGEENDKRKSV